MCCDLLVLRCVWSGCVGRLSGGRGWGRRLCRRRSALAYATARRRIGRPRQWRCRRGRPRGPRAPGVSSPLLTRPEPHANGRATATSRVRDRGDHERRGRRRGCEQHGERGQTADAWSATGGAPSRSGSSTTPSAAAGRGRRPEAGRHDAVQPRERRSGARSTSLTCRGISACTASEGATTRHGRPAERAAADQGVGPHLRAVDRGRGRGAAQPRPGHDLGGVRAQGCGPTAGRRRWRGPRPPPPRRPGARPAGRGRRRGHAPTVLTALHRRDLGVVVASPPAATTGPRSR